MNKERLNIEDSKFKQAWEDAREKIADYNMQFKEALDSIVKTYSQQEKDYVEIAKAAEENYKQSSSFKQWFLGASDQEKYQRQFYYEKQRQNIASSNLSDTSKNAALGFLQEDLDSEITQSGSFLANTMEKTADEVSDSLQDILLGYKSFSDSMKSIGLEMSKYMLKQFTETLTEMIFKQNNANAMTTTSSVIGSWGNGIWGTIGGLFGKLFKHHSGGIATVGANAELPGTDEQLALLKGGERVLSPAENTSYKSNVEPNGSSPVVFNNFNIKAWDSKDVQKYLLENKQLINKITYEGIKNNDSHLRNIVQNA